MCAACAVERKLTAVEDFSKGHKLRSFECPVCHTTLRIVVRRDNPELLKEGAGHALALAATPVLARMERRRIVAAFMKFIFAFARPPHWRPGFCDAAREPL